MKKSFVLWISKVQQFNQIYFMGKIKLSGGDLRWLHSKGGRDERDVCIATDGSKYVLMVDGKGGDKKVYF